MSSRRPHARLLLAPLLAACGTIPTPSVPLPDTTVPLANTFITQGKVVYVDQDGLRGSTLPTALQGLTIRGDALYDAASGGTLGTVKLYVRPSLDALEGRCMRVPGVLGAPTLYACEPQDETAQGIGTLNVQARASVPFTLSGPALDTAARSGRGYFGFQVVTGTAIQGETVELTNLKAQARL